MCSNVKGLFKRILPFFATFIVGLFIASFFVQVGPPRFEGFRGRGWERHKMFDRIQAENEQLKNENLRLRNELNTSRIRSGRGMSEEFIPPTVDMPVEMPPMPPAPPRLQVRH